MISKTGRNFMLAGWFLIVFLLLQIIVTFGVSTGWLLHRGLTVEQAMANISNNTLNYDATALILIQVVFALVVVILFAACRWSPFSRRYLQSRPWAVLVWVLVLACGTVIPSMFLEEKLGMEMPESLEHIFSLMLSRSEGYVCVGLLVPLAEEMVFRGAILRVLLKVFNEQWHWVAIVLSALLFGLAHGNMPQFFHASLIGLLLGWMYYRTDSILPGVVFHWMNNSIAFAAFNLYPQTSDATLTELLGSERMVWYAVGCSLLIMLPALFQLAIRMRKA